ncbi:hypothetical protein HETIRDRAFT_427239 [Heterobasidion irregulare TC 32-1]|uniref:Uncharacterized protein n=1 Tax=Heterobasidion irregulare (strain TC 32-1) TaxID=747525 RepID=W4K9N7_HETIT|nr:uncharacterized protein HETIRDRAFT_427239 [Heterobasidion irregulare TC 32-1]ETW82065.1 hypothetical protein HETIRDRAFT_427239 [Heterobasidion irregulare TC 32-1]
MLLHNDNTASSPSRNSSPNIILMVANLDIKHVNRGTSPTPPESNTTITILTQSLNNFSDNDAKDYAKFKEREWTHTNKQPSRRSSQDAPWDEGTYDKNNGGPSGPTTEVPPSIGVTTTPGTGSPLGLHARGGGQQPGNGATDPVPVLPGITKLTVPVSGQVPSTMGRITHRPNPHFGELEQYMDTLLQQNIISANNQEMKTTIASLQIRTLALQTNPNTASGYEDNDGRPRALLIYLDEFTQYVNQELLLALLFLGELGDIQAVRTNPFCVITWNVPPCIGKRPAAIPNPRGVPHSCGTPSSVTTRGYEIFPYPMEIPTRRNRPSIEEPKEEETKEPRQPSNAECILAGVFNTSLECLLLIIDFVQTRDRIAKVAAELAILIQRLEEIASRLNPSSMPRML